MTLDEMIYAKLTDRIPDDMVDTIKDIAKEYALQVAEQAVEEEKKEWGEHYPESIFTLDELLVRIKKLTEEI